MGTEKIPPRQPEPDTSLPMTDLDIIQTPDTKTPEIPFPVVIIGPGPLDINNLPGSRPLEDEETPRKPHLNS